MDLSNLLHQLVSVSLIFHFIALVSKLWNMNKMQCPEFIKFLWFQKIAEWFPHTHTYRVRSTHSHFNENDTNIWKFRSRLSLKEINSKFVNLYYFQHAVFFAVVRWRLCFWIFPLNRSCIIVSYSYLVCVGRYDLIAPCNEQFLDNEHNCNKFPSNRWRPMTLILLKFASDILVLNRFFTFQWNLEKPGQLYIVER